MRIDSFNEAAGIPRGRPIDRSVAGQITISFNEAAGIPRGRRGERPVTAPMSYRFNEAAGIPRGRPNAPFHAASVALASMRPRVFPAEDREWSIRTGCVPALLQ